MGSVVTLLGTRHRPYVTPGNVRKPTLANWNSHNDPPQLCMRALCLRHCLCLPLGTPLPLSTTRKQYQLIYVCWNAKEKSKYCRNSIRQMYLKVPKMYFILLVSVTQSLNSKSSHYHGFQKLYIQCCTYISLLYNLTLSWKKYIKLKN